MTEWTRSGLSAALVLLSGTLATGLARAAEIAPPPIAEAAAGESPGAFGAHGEIVLSTDLPMGGPALNFVHSSANMNGGSGNVIQIQPALDYFLLPNLSLGATVGLTRSSNDATLGGTTISFTSTAISLGPRVGYNIVLATQASLWIRGVIDYTHTSQSSGAADQSGYTISVGADAVVLWHPVRHFFLGGGPAFGTNVVSKVSSNGMSADGQKQTTFGLVSIIGGYFGGL